MNQCLSGARSGSGLVSGGQKPLPMSPWSIVQLEAPNSPWDDSLEPTGSSHELVTAIPSQSSVAI